MQSQCRFEGSPIPVVCSIWFRHLVEESVPDWVPGLFLDFVNHPQNEALRQGGIPPRPTGQHLVRTVVVHGEVDGRESTQESCVQWKCAPINVVRGRHYQEIRRNRKRLDLVLVPRPGEIQRHSSFGHLHQMESLTQNRRNIGPVNLLDEKDRLNVLVSTAVRKEFSVEAIKNDGVSLRHRNELSHEVAVGPAWMKLYLAESRIGLNLVAVDP